MAMVSVHIDKSDVKTAGFRAAAGGHQAVGRTMGEALDALMADWEDAIQEADVYIEPLPNEEEEEEYVEPYLVNKGGLWVIAGGGKMLPEDSDRDFVAEMREERMRSFFPEALRGDDGSSS